jgi:hypothetical protein
MSYSIARTAGALACLLITVSGTRAEPVEKLGNVSFANSCEPAVQPHLQRAVALLHSFWWSEGDKAFRDVLQRDPSCAIAGWGIAAIAIGNPYATGPTPDGAKRAQEAIAQARAIGTKSERERGYIEAVAAYYDNFAERAHPARLRSMADAFEALAKQFPDDETQIFSAIYLVATQPPTDKTFARAMQGAGILEAQFAKHSDHPGVAHYLIHAYDYPSIADKGLAAAMCYADIAPSAPHALHMPSHIFTRVGLWQESATTNHRSIAAAQADTERPERLHALDYMVYADLQLARDGDAKAGVELARQTPAEGTTVQGSFYSRAAVPARYAVERGQWAEAARLDDPDASKFTYADAIRYFARALGAARSGDPDAAEKDVARLREIAEALKAAKNAYWANEVEVERTGAEAWIAFAKGQRDQGLSLMRAAADMEDKSEKSAISPGRLIPAREPLYSARCQPAHQIAAHEHGEEEHRQHHRDAAGRDLAPLEPGILHEVDDRHRCRHRLGTGQDQREEKVVPRQDETEDAGRRQAGRGERQRDAGKRTPKAGAVDPRRLFEAARHGVEKSLHRPDDQGEVEGDVDQGEPGHRVHQIEPGVGKEERYREGNRRRHTGDENPHRHLMLPAEPPPRQHIGRRHADR